MKRLLFLLFSILFVLLPPSSVLAHSGPPFILIDGQATVINPVYFSGNKLKVANEIAPKKYLVNQKIVFGVDRALLSVDPNLIGENNFSWDFGDGNKKSGLDNNHSFKKTGSFIVTLRAKDPTYDNEVELEIVKIDILPTVNYTLPQAKIKVNEQLIENPIETIVATEMGEEILFDASFSKGSGLKYQWDFGDGSEMGTGKQIKRIIKFDGSYNYSVFPVLRVTDANRLFSDAYVQISNDKSIQTTTNSAQNSTKNNNFSANFLKAILTISLVSLIVGPIILVYFLRKKNTA